MTVGILGSGFGLYGYLPAVTVGCGEKVVLPIGYRDRLQSRSELQLLTPFITWARDDEDLLGNIDTLILARRPVDQVHQVADCLHRPGIAKLLLEKPLAPDPDSAALLLTALRNSRKTFRIGFNFRLTDWAPQLAAFVGAADARDSWSIDWQFRAHHYVHSLTNWKRSVSRGGGALRFFGIHILAVLAELGYSGVRESRIRSNADDEAEAWAAVFFGTDRPQCKVFVDTKADVEGFKLRGNSLSAVEGLEIHREDPFDGIERQGTFDQRFALLVSLVNDLLRGHPTYYSWYESSVELWARVESRTEYMSSAQFDRC